MMGAPAGVSQDLQQFTRFYPSGDRQGVRIHTCAAIYDILKDSIGSAGPALNDVTPGRYVSAQLNLTDPAGLTNAGAKTTAGYLTPVFDLLGSAFVRYKVNKVVFHYEPQASATDSQRLVFAFAADPLHPVLWNATVPDQGDLLSLADSIAFMPWRAWSMDVTDRIQDKELFTYSDASTTVTEFVERFSDFGVISCVTSSGGQVADAKCGVLYMETDIELQEFCPISVTRPAILRKVAAKVSKHAQSKGDHSRPKPLLEETESAETITVGGQAYVKVNSS
jgi:hypothetical protein